MGMYHSTYFAYGVRIPDTDPEHIEETELGEGVGYLLAGDYDRDMTFLTTQCKEVDLGEFQHVTPQTADDEQRAAWDQALRTAAARLGVEPQSEPGWFVVPDLS
ncbi:hypothetical protein [Streptomyces sp. NPDC085596]|uniref:hypothetical protein n=1 Tax=Streptomyces sp. NPDC085596 TaxID=3365731 RepID=UPI0037D05E78